MKTSQSILTLGVLLILLYACNEKPEKITTASLDGVYEQIGYGRIVTIDNGVFVMYDNTAISCLPVLDGSISIFGDNLSFANDTLKLKDGINEYKYVRLDSTPDLCGKELSGEKQNDPVYNFEVLAANFDQHYAYFELRNVNWDSLYTATKIKITSETSTTELYRILEDMLDSFDDGHIGLDAPSEVEEAAEALKTEQAAANNSNEETYGDFQIAQMVSEHYLKDTMKSSRSDLIRWGNLDEDIAYLQINLMMGHGTMSLADSLQGMPYLRAYFDSLEDLETSEEHTRLEVAGIKSTLSAALADMADSKALVLDVRFNGGGKDEVGLEIMRHFNAERRLVFSKKARFDDEFTPITKVFLESSEEAYTKPVILLTSQHSASATEIMILSSLLLEHVTRVGSHSEGVFSDVMEKALPNGWEVGMSNEIYLDTEGNNYENRGIPPTVSLNYANDIQDVYRSLVADLEGDKQQILKEVRKILE